MLLVIVISTWVGMAVTALVLRALHARLKHHAELRRTLGLPLGHAAVRADRHARHHVLAQALYARVGFAPWANPVLWTVLTLALLLAAGGLSDLFLRCAVHPLPARAGGGGAGLAAVAARLSCGARGPCCSPPRRWPGGRGHRGGGLAARPARCRAALARAQVGDGAGGHGHRRAAWAAFPRWPRPSP